MYGTLAVCGALVLGARGGSEPESPWTVLEGRTERGALIQLTLFDGKVHSIYAKPAVWCPAHQVWRSWHWSPIHGGSGEFRRRGSRLTVREREVYKVTRRSRKTSLLATVLRARLADDAESARGTIESRWHWGGFACTATVRFSARRTS